MRAHLYEQMEMLGHKKKKSSHLDRGLAYLTLENYREAIREFERQPHSKEAQLYRGMACVYLNQTSEALLSFTRALEIDRLDYFLWLVRADLYKHLQLYHHALEDYRQAIRLDTQQQHTKCTYFNRGMVHFACAHYENALSDFNKALELEMDSKAQARIHNNCAAVYLRLENLPTALEHMSKAIDLNPNKPDYFYQRGVLYSKQKKYMLAIADFEKTLALEPDHSHADSHLHHLKNLNEKEETTSFHTTDTKITTMNSDAFFQISVEGSKIEPVKSEIVFQKSVI